MGASCHSIVNRWGVVVAVALLAGCAAGAEPETSPEPPTDATSAVAAPSAAEAIARRYLAAYQDFDWPAVEPLLADDMIFVDATSEGLEAPGAPFDWKGRDAVLAGMRAFAPDFGLSRLRYETERVYEAGGATVFVGVLHAIYPNETGGETWYGAPAVTVVRVAAGRVTEHRDFIDYAGFAPEEPRAIPAP